jgi:hypothetical protein
LLADTIRKDLETIDEGVDDSVPCDASVKLPEKSELETECSSNSDRGSNNTKDLLMENKVDTSLNNEERTSVELTSKEIDNMLPIDGKSLMGSVTVTMDDNFQELNHVENMEELMRVALQGSQFRACHEDDNIIDISYHRENDLEKDGEGEEKKEEEEEYVLPLGQITCSPDVRSYARETIDFSVDEFDNGDVFHSQEEEEEESPVKRASPRSVCDLTSPVAKAPPTNDAPVEIDDDHDYER